MRESLVLVPVLAAAACVVCLAAAAKPRVLSRVTVRAYNNFGVGSKTLSRAEAISEGILADAGVDADWRNCRMPTGPASRLPDDCTDPVQDDEVIVRIVQAREDGGPTAPFGYSFVNAEARRGALSTLFVDRINAAADRVRLDQGVLLGRAMAHELGHLLLGTTNHSPDGLMRAVWPDAALLSRSPADWTFSPLDLARLRLALSFDSSTTPSLR